MKKISKLTIKSKSIQSKTCHNLVGFNLEYTGGNIKK